MQRYIFIRLLQAILTLAVVSLIVFSLARLSGSPLDTLVPEEADDEMRAAVSELWGLDQPFYQQYLVFLKNAVTLEFGPSFKWPGQTAMDKVRETLPATLQLAGFALVISLLVAIPLGVMSAYRKGTFIDTGGKTVALLGQSLPSFWLGIVLVWVFAVWLGWLPTSGKQGWTAIILPGITTATFSMAAFMRITRSAMLNVLDSEYIKLARLKGLSERRVVWKHGLKNAAIPPLTLFGIITGTLITGLVTVETIFAWPGMGRLALQAVFSRDYQVVQAVVMVISAVFISMNLLVDILYAYLDPRVRYATA